MEDERLIFRSLVHLPVWEKAEQNRTPLMFDLELTARCNNKCRHCYINLPEKKLETIEKEISFDQIKAIVDQAVSMGTLWCLITGGEPLLRDDFADIYMYLKKKGLLLSVFTNATLLTDEHIRIFKKYPPRNMEVTVYGITPQTYEKVTRNPGSFQLFKEGIKKLKEAGIKTGLKAVAMRSNFHELPDIFSYCRKFSDTEFRFDPFLHFRYDGDPSRNKDIQSERLTADEIVNLEKEDKKRYHSLRKSCEKSLEFPSGVQNSPYVFRCSAGINSFLIDSFGHFRVCASFCHPDYVYDLKKISLSQVWHDFVPDLIHKQSDRKEFLEKCAKCQLIDLCMWCPATAHLETGKIDMPVDSFCQMAQKRSGIFLKK